MPVFVWSKLLPRGAVDKLMHYCMRPKAECNSASGRPWYRYFMLVCSIVKTITPRYCGQPDALLHEAEGVQQMLMHRKTCLIPILQELTNLFRFLWYYNALILFILYVIWLANSEDPDESSQKV